MQSKIMYIENKTNEINARGRIGRVTFSKTGKSLYYNGKMYRSLKGGYKRNYFEVGTGDEYWISGPKKSGLDRLYQTPGIDIDEDVREEYWLTIRNLPARVKQTWT